MMYLVSRNCFVPSYLVTALVILINLFSDGGGLKTELIKVGKHNYFGFELELFPVRTLLRGLCYKLEMSREKPLWLHLIVSSSSKAKDRLKRVDLFMAAENTWQGTIHKWPYSKVPPFVTGELDTESYKLIPIEIKKENQWNWRSGISGFDNCMNDGNASECSSIFDPMPCEHQNQNM